MIDPKMVELTSYNGIPHLIAPVVTDFDQVVGALLEVVHQARKMELEAQNELEELKRRVASSVVDVALEELKKTFSDHEEVTAYLDQVHQDILDNVDLFRAEENGDDGEALVPASEEFRRYQVNVLSTIQLPRAYSAA